MRTALVVLTAILLAATAWPQQQNKQNPMEQLLSSKKYYRCIDYYYNATLIIPRLYDEGRIDSIYMILDFVEKECKPTPRTHFTRILLKIDEGKFSEDLYDSTILNDIIYYQHAIKSVNTYGYEHSYYSYDNDPDADRTYDEFIAGLARKMYDKYPPGTLEHLLSGFLMGDFTYFFHDLKTPAYAGTRLQEYYFTFIWNMEDRYKNTGTNYAGILGYWHPLGANEIFGDKPELGFVMGYLYSTWQVDLVFAMRFLDSKNQYIYVENGVPDTTDHFFGLYAGADFGRELFSKNNHRFEIVGGVAYDGVQTRVAENDNGGGHNIGSLNLNIGFRHRIYLSRYHDWYVGFQGRYNFVNYDSDGGSDLSGNTISIQFILGRINNGAFKRYADDLGYFD